MIGVLVCIVHLAVLPFPIKLQSGTPIYEQIVHAVKRAVAMGHLPPGSRFPSVRAISQELNVNPNTVQKAVSELTALQILEVHPGQGCFIQQRSASRKEIRNEAIRPLIEKLLVEAAHHGVSKEVLLEMIQIEWRKLND